MASLEPYRFISSRHGPLIAMDGRLMNNIGSRQLGRAETQDVLRELLLGAKKGDRKHLVVLAGADEGPGSRPRTNTNTLIARVLASVDRGRIVFVHGWAPIVDDDVFLTYDGAAAHKHDPAEDALVVRAQPDRDEVALEGRRYLLIPARRWARYQANGHFEIVRPVEAKGVCQRQAARVINDADRRAAWEEAAEWLGDLRRPVTKTEGLLLIRRVMMMGDSEVTLAPVATPSQMKKEVATKELTWIELVVLDDEDRPFRGTLSLELPDGRTIETTPDEDGSARFDQIPPGNCKLTFIELDPHDFDDPAQAA